MGDNDVKCPLSFSSNKKNNNGGGLPGAGIHDNFDKMYFDLEESPQNFDDEFMAQSESHLKSCYNSHQGFSPNQSSIQIAQGGSGNTGLHNQGNYNINGG